ncbi:MAG: hypothetical protein ACI87V_000913, partial [Flavobacteriales bacterium]
MFYTIQRPYLTIQLFQIFIHTSMVQFCSVKIQQPC